MSRDPANFVCAIVFLKPLAFVKDRTYSEIKLSLSNAYHSGNKEKPTHRAANACAPSGVPRKMATARAQKVFHSPGGKDGRSHWGRAGVP